MDNRFSRVERVWSGKNFLVAVIAFGAAVLAACTSSAPQATPVPATPTIDPAIYNQVPETHVFEPGQCFAELTAPAPAYTSNTLGGQSSGEIPPGKYEVGVAAQYSTSLWYALNIAPPNYINSTSVASLDGDCELDK